MSTSVGTKVRKKQSAKQVATPQPVGIAESDRDFEQALLSLENACVRILESQFAKGRQDTERLYWQQRLKNIATPVSLALTEYKGPRRFHYHYRHRSHDESILHPVLEPTPVELLSMVCRDSLRQCHDDLVGIQDEALLKARDMLEHALLNFLQKYSHATHKKNGKA